MKTHQHPPRLLRLDEVMARVGLARPTIYKAIQAGKFPPPCKLLGSRSSAWSDHEISDWIEQRLQERTSRTAAEATRLARSVRSKRGQQPTNPAEHFAREGGR